MLLAAFFIFFTFALHSYNCIPMSLGTAPAESNDKNLSFALSYYLNASEKAANHLLPGSFRYYFYDWVAQRFEVLGEASEDIIKSVPVRHLVHPEDIGTFVNFHHFAQQIYLQKLKATAFNQYVWTCCFRSSEVGGQYRIIHQQSMALDWGTDSAIKRSLVAHTDVTALGMVPNPMIVFRAGNGLPTFWLTLSDPENIRHFDTELAFSGRELELIKLLAEGLASKEIAERMGITKNTVDTHRRKLLRKAGCKNTSALAVFMVKRGLL